MDLFEQFRQAETTIANQRGAFVLFALFEQDDLAGQYDVVVSAEWLPRGRNSYLEIADLVGNAMRDKNWWLQFGKLVVLPPDGPFVQAVLSRMPRDVVEHDLILLPFISYEGELFRNAVVITAQKFPVGTKMPQTVVA